VKIWICSGETLNVSLLVSFFDQIGTQNHSMLCNFYGSTEVTDATWIAFESKEQALSLADGTNLPLGIPVSNASVIILDLNRHTIKLLYLYPYSKL
jgi:non-ribosomal peptide synthetase component F